MWHFPLLSVSLPKDPSFENSYLLAKKHFIFLKNTQDVTWKSFNIKFELVLLITKEKFGKTGFYLTFQKLFVSFVDETNCKTDHKSCSSWVEGGGGMGDHLFFCKSSANETFTVSRNLVLRSVSHIKCGTQRKRCYSSRLVFNNLAKLTKILTKKINATGFVSFQ